VGIIIFQMELVEMDGISGANNHAQDQNLVGLEKNIARLENQDRVAI
jgi:hypothetical protein